MRYILALAVLAASCANSTTPGQPGNPEVYEAISAETDCQALQETFDRAWENWNQAKARGEDAGPGSEREWTLAYMNAADERMISIGCYD